MHSLCSSVSSLNIVDNSVDDHVEPNYLPPLTIEVEDLPATAPDDSPSITPVLQVEVRDMPPLFTTGSPPPVPPSVRSSDHIELENLSPMLRERINEHVNLDVPPISNADRRMIDQMAVFYEDLRQMPSYYVNIYVEYYVPVYSYLVTCFCTLCCSLTLTTYKRIAFIDVVSYHDDSYKDCYFCTRCSCRLYSFISDIYVGN